MLRAIAMAQPQLGRRSMAMDGRDHMGTSSPPQITRRQIFRYGAVPAAGFVAGVVSAEALGADEGRSARAGIGVPPATATAGIRADGKTDDTDAWRNLIAATSK